MPSHERLAIVDSLKPLDHAFLFNDDDNSAIDAIKKVQAMYPGCKIKFLNGGDRTKDNIPELIVKDIEFVSLAYRQPHFLCAMIDALWIQK